MTGLHLHLMLNHLPIVGAFLAIPLLLVAAIWIRERGLLIASVAVVLFTAGGAVLATVTGEAAEEIVEELPWGDHDAIHVHEERAELAMWIALGTGAVGLFALGAGLLRRPRLARVAVLATLAGTVATAAAMSWAGIAGGDIRHDELRGL